MTLRTRVVPRLASASLWGLRALCLGGALGYLALFAWLVWGRARHPFELEWMEGGMVDHVARLLHGKPLYPPPSIDFVPYIYNPLFYVLALPFTWIFGLDFLALRLVSIGSSCACFALIFGLVRRETGAWLPAVLATGLYAATYKLSGAWFDVARVDSLEVALCLATLYVGRHAATPRQWLGCAVLSFGAFATKQSGVILVPALGLYLLSARGLRAGLWYGVPALTLVATGIVVCDVASHGWYWFYAYEVPASHPLVNSLVIDFWKYEVLQPLPVACVLGLYFIAHPAREPADTGRRCFGLLISAMLTMSYLSRIHSGSWLNDDMPAHAALALSFGLGAGRLITRSQPTLARAGELFVLLVTLAQYTYLYYDPRPLLPTAADRMEGEHLLQAIAAYPGEVLVAHHAFITRRVGKPSHAHDMATWDVLRIERDPRGAKQQLLASYARAFAHKRFSAVFLDERFHVMSELERYYRPAPATFIGDRNALVPKTGAAIRPVLLYVPK